MPKVLCLIVRERVAARTYFGCLLAHDDVYGMNRCAGRNYLSFGNYLLFQIVIPYILPAWAYLVE